MIKYGIKIWLTNENYFLEAVDLYKNGLIDFVELYIVPEAIQRRKWNILKNIPIQVHTPHFFHSFNIFELSKEKIDLFRNQVVRIANFLNAEYIVLHAGLGSDAKIFKKNITKIYNEKILIENMPKIGLNNKTCFGYSLKQLEFIKKECGLDICLDFGHAFKSAISQKIDYKEFINSLILKLEPYYFHLCGASKNSEEDEHLNLLEGDIDFLWIKKILLNLAEKKDIYLVFEVPKKKGLKNDIDNIKYFKKN